MRMFWFELVFSLLASILLYKKNAPIAKHAATMIPTAMPTPMPTALAFDPLSPEEFDPVDAIEQSEPV